MKSEKVPETDSIEELAQFWDTHDVTDFEDQLEEVTEPVFQRRSAVRLSIKLEPEEVEALKRLATARGLEETALIRQWVVEKLQQS